MAAQSHGFAEGDCIVSSNNNTSAGAQQTGQAHAQQNLGPATPSAFGNNTNLYNQYINTYNANKTS